MASQSGAEKCTRSDRVRRQLELEILSGRHAAGIRLDEVALAARLGCSRTPVREAFGQLVALGLLTRRPHCGVYVAADAGRRAREVIEAYAEVEAACAALAVERMAPRRRANLPRQAERDPAQLRRAIRQACNNRVLAEQAEALERQVAAFRCLEGTSADDLDRLAARRVAEAVAAGVPDEARRALRERLGLLCQAATGALGNGVEQAA